MSNILAGPEAKYLYKILECDYNHGVLIWKHRPDRLLNWNRRYCGKEAGCHNKTSDYMSIRIDGVKYYSHRVIWAMRHGKWPTMEVDHKDGNRRNNCIKNLRLATKSQNMHNRGPTVYNSSGYKGVYAYSIKGGTRYAAQIMINGVSHTKSGFFTPEDAYACHCEMAIKYHKKFAKIA